MKPFLPCCLLLAIGAALAASAEVVVLGVEDRASVAVDTAVVASEPTVLRVFVSTAATASKTAETAPEVFQIGGVLARPLDVPVSVETDPIDARVQLWRLVPPAVERVTRLRVRVGTEWVALTVFPSPETRSDRLALRSALATASLRVGVCGAGPELRDYLREVGLEFEELGREAPVQVAADMLLVGVLEAEDWARLAAPAAPGRVLALVENGALLPGVYTLRRRAAGGIAIKVTLPLRPLLSSDPRARETLLTLLFTALAPLDS